MRLFNRFYLAALLLPLLILALTPDLWIPARTLASQWNGESNVDYIPIQSWTLKTSDVLARGPLTLDAQIWAVNKGDFPSDLKRFERDKPDQSRNHGKMLAFAELSRQHPNNALLLVQALISVQSGDGRVAGPWESDWRMPPSQNSPPLDWPIGTPYFPQSAIPTKSFTPDELALGLRLAQRGQKIEPQNTFFDWMAARFLFALSRDAEATQTLITAGQKTGFDLHWREIWRGSIATHERVHPLLAEEKAVLGLGILLPHLSTLRHVNHLALWSAMQYEDAGQKQKTLQIETALAKLNRLRFHKSLFDIEQISGASNLQVVWSGSEMRRWARVLNVGKPPSPYKSLSQTEAIRYSARQFIAYCNRNQLPQLARETSVIAPQMADVLAKIDAYQSRGAFLFPASDGTLAKLAMWWFSATLARYLLFISLASWLFLTIFGPIFPPRHATVPRVSSRVVFYPVIFGTAGVVLLTALSTQFLRSSWLGGLAFCGLPNNNGAEYAGISACIALATPLFISVLTTIIAMARLRKFLPRAQLQIDEKNAAQEWKDTGFAPEAYEPFRWFWKMQAFLWFRAPLVVAFGSAIYWLALTFSLTSSWDTDSALALLLGALAAYVLALVGRWRFGMPAAQRGVIFAGFYTLRRTQAWMIPVGLWMMLITLWETRALRPALETQLQNYLQSENQ